MRSTVSKITVGFILGASVAGGVATAVTIANPVVKACADNRTLALYASNDGKCPSNRTAVDLGTPPTGATSIRSIVQKVAPSVVSISVTSGLGGDTGSGVIYQSTATYSYIVTNNHVVDAAVSSTGATIGTIAVELDNGDSESASIVGRDPIYDLAVLKINRGNQPVIPYGNSDSISIGDPVIAFGSPLGLSRTVTSGIVSSLNRPVMTGSTNSESYINAIQTDAAINPGNSGGPLTDGAGRLIGINSAIASLGSGTSGSIGLGFAIPINEAQRILNEIITTGKSTRPILGFNADASYRGKGARIYAITPGGPADKAGIVAGSVITAIDGVKVADYVEAIVRIRVHAPGSQIKLTITTPSGDVKTFTVTLDSAPSLG